MRDLILVGISCRKLLNITEYYLAPFRASCLVLTEELCVRKGFVLYVRFLLYHSVLSLLFILLFCSATFMQDGVKISSWRLYWQTKVYCYSVSRSDL